MINFTPYAEHLIFMYMSKAGMSLHLKGADYICNAVKMNLKDMAKIGVVYFHIAKQYNTTEICIERDIRYCIESAWEKNRESFCKVFGERYINKYPTNKELIFLLVYKIKDKLYIL